MAIHQALLEAAFDLAREVSAETVTGICRHLNDGSIPRADLLSPDAAYRFGVVHTAWRIHAPALSSRELAAVLASTAFAVRKETVERRTELVWTGPAAIGTPVRSTEPALLELIDGAAQSLYIVTFAAYRVPAVAWAIARALARRVRVVFVLESDRDNGGSVSFDPLPHLNPSGSSTCEVYSWPVHRRVQDARGGVGTLHAKFAVADRRCLLVSSANLTEHAFNLNIELGVMLTGGTVPEQAATHVDSLIRDGVLQRVSQAA